MTSPLESSTESPAVVALGGGHGLAATLTAARLITDDITAIVTVADDGGSSGRLRREFGVLPPGDLRMALAALCDDTQWGHTWRDVLQHRFEGEGELGGHAVGNLLIVALWELHSDPVAGLAWVGKLLGARGSVLPMAAVPLGITAKVAGLDPTDPDATTMVHGQGQIATTTGEVQEVYLAPDQPPARPEALEAIAAADVIILGPGSWFTSVMPHLLVPELRSALEASHATRILTLNAELHEVETHGFSEAQHVDVVASHAPGLTFDAVLADSRVVEDPQALEEAAARVGAKLVLAPVVSATDPRVHDPLRLAAAYRDIMGTAGQQRRLW